VRARNLAPVRTQLRVDHLTDSLKLIGQLVALAFRRSPSAAQSRADKDCIATV